MTDDEARPMTLRPKGQHRSYRVVWKGTDPKIESSNWAPGYTDAHTETRAEAIAHAMAVVLHDTALIREKWIKLNLAAEAEKRHGDEHDRATDFLGAVIEQEADDRYPESPLAPENEEKAEAFIEGAKYGMSNSVIGVTITPDMNEEIEDPFPEGSENVDTETVDNTPEERAQLQELINLGIDITKPIEFQSPEAQAAYQQYYDDHQDH